MCTEVGGTPHPRLQGQHEVGHHGNHIEEKLEMPEGGREHGRVCGAECQGRRKDVIKAPAFAGS